MNRQDLSPEEWRSVGRAVAEGMKAWIDYVESGEDGPIEVTDEDRLQVEKWRQALREQAAERSSAHLTEE